MKRRDWGSSVGRALELTLPQSVLLSGSQKEKKAPHTPCSLEGKEKVNEEKQRVTGTNERLESERLDTGCLKFVSLNRQEVLTRARTRLCPSDGDLGQVLTRWT